MEALKIILIVFVFLIFVGVLGLITAKLNGIDLDKDPREMPEKQMILFAILRPFFCMAILLKKIFKKKK